MRRLEMAVWGVLCEILIEKSQSSCFPYRDIGELEENIVPEFYPG